MSRQKLEQEIEANRLSRASNESLGQKLVQKHASVLGNLVIAESILIMPPIAFDLYQIKASERVNNDKTRGNLLKVVASKEEGLVAQAYVYLTYLDYIEDNKPWETIKKCDFQHLSLIALPNTFGAVAIIMYHTIYSNCYVFDYSLDINVRP
jgi:hypothetical protein